MTMLHSLSPVVESGLELAGTGLLPVSTGAGLLAVLLGHMPLACASDLSAVNGARLEGVYAKLRELERGGFADMAVMGWTRHRVARWWLTESGVRGMGVLGSTWHEEWGRCGLLDRLPMVESFYRLLPFIKSYGRLRAFQWLTGLSFDAAARFERGWVALYWSGLWQSEATLKKRFEHLGRDLVKNGLLDASVWPGMLCFVVNDEWQRELVYRAAKKAGLIQHVAVLSLTDDSRDGAWEGGVSRGFVFQAFDGGEVGGWPFDRRLEALPWGSVGGQLSGRMLDCVAEWPGMSMRVGKSLFRETSGTRRASHGVRDLVARGLVDIEKSTSHPRYSVSARGVDVLRRRDRMSYAHTNNKSQAWSWLRRPRLQSHEDGVMGLVSEFLMAGLPVAAGWRSWEPLGGGGGIAPDAMVRLDHSPYGPGWHYVEYERSARGQVRVSRKLRGYSSPRRQDRWPLLVVARDAAAEDVFSQIGAEGQLLMATTTLERLGASGAVGNLDCWRVYGQPITLG